MRYARSSNEIRKIVGIAKLLDQREDQLERESEVIRAMQYRFAHRHPVRHFFWRKPWRSAAPIAWSDGKTLRVKVANLVGWLRFAHDCTDPSIGCSCHPSFRFPDPKEGD